MRPLTLAGALSVAALSAQAATLSYTGNLASDNDVQLLSFTVGANSDVTLITFSYAGGDMADGTEVDDGGFDPTLFLFDSTGALIAQNSDGNAKVPVDPASGERYDSYLSVLDLSAGEYTVAITQYDNEAKEGTLSGGFSETDPFFTAKFGCSNGQFCSYDGYNRTSFWALDIQAVERVVPAVPLPASLPLALAGFGAFGLAARRRKG